MHLLGHTGVDHPAAETSRVQINLSLQQADDVLLLDVFRYEKTEVYVDPPKWLMLTCHPVAHPPQRAHSLVLHTPFSNG